MSSIQNIYTNHFLPIATNQKVVIGTGCLVAIPALEMALRAIQNIDVAHRLQSPPEKETNEARTTRLNRIEKLKNASINRGMGALIFGACALNSFPGSGTIGLTGYLIYSHFNLKNEQININPCFTTFFTGIGITLLSEFTKHIVKTSSSKVAHAVSKAGPVLKKLAAKASSAALKLIGGIAKLFLSVFRHPRLGLGVLAGIGLLIVCIKYGPPLSKAVKNSALLISQLAKGALYTGSLAVQGIIISIKPLSRAFYVLPSVLMKTAQVTKSVVYFIFHPLQAIGLS